MPGLTCAALQASTAIVSRSVPPAENDAHGSVPGLGGPAFELHLAASPAVPVVVAVPHAGRAYPAALIGAMREPQWSCVRLEDRYADLVARDIASATGAGLMIAHAPRAMIDLNRAVDDVDWSMIAGSAAGGGPRTTANRRARSGLGLVPRRLLGLGEIWKGQLTHADMQERVRSVHRPYHQALGAALERIRDAWGGALLIDLHSMPPLKMGAADARPPEFVIGDRFGASCDPGLARIALDHLAAAGRAVAHNRPYSGGYVLDEHAAPRRGIHALQIEMCRSTYLDSRLEQPGPRLPTIARLLSGLVRALATELVERGEGSAPRLAAE